MRMKVTFSDEEQAAIDALRGQLPAATWVRQLVRQAGVAAKVLAAEKAAAAEGARDLIAVGMLATGHHPGCRCLSCERARGNVS